MNVKGLDKRLRFKWILDALSLGAVLQYCAYRFLQSTMFNFYYSNTYKLITMGLLLVFGSVRWGYIFVQKWREKDRKERRKFLLYCGGAAILALPFFYVGWRHDYKVLIFLPICCMCLYDMETEKVLKAFICVIGILLIATILCCLSGTVRNLISTDNGQIVGSYGIINTSDFASYFTFLLSIIWCSKESRKWYYELLFAIFNIFISIVIYYFTQSKTCLISCALLSLFVFFDCLNKNIHKRHSQTFLLDKIIKLLSLVVFPLIGMLLIILISGRISYEQWARDIDRLVSNRLYLSMLPFLKYGIHPFGNTITSMHGVGGTVIFNWTNGYGYIDVAYVMLAIKYGWVITAFFSGLWIWLTLKAFQERRRKIAFVMVILAIHAFSEARILDINYNIFLAMPFCSLKQNEEQSESIWISRKKVIAIIPTGITIFLIYAVMPCIMSWLRTFFAIEEWNIGTKAKWSLLFCVCCVLLVSILLYTLSRYFSFHSYKKKCSIIMCLSILLCSSLVINSRIERSIDDQKERLFIEKDILKYIQENATQPVYIAEASEIYKRTMKGIVDHCFSTDELGRVKGTIITDGNVEALGIIMTDGNYIQLSPWSGLYSYDSKLLSRLEDEGFEVKSYFSGKHQINLEDVAFFNELTLSKEEFITIENTKKVETKNSEYDQLAGTYMVSFELAINPESKQEDDSICFVEVLGEAGEKTIIRKEIKSASFNPDGQCNFELTYKIEATPKVSYTISSTGKTPIIVKKIWWQRID